MITKPIAAPISETVETLLGNLPNVSDAQLPTILNLVFPEGQTDPSNYGDAAFKLLAALSPKQAMFVAQHSNVCANLYQGLGSVFNLGIGVLRYHDSDYFVIREDNPQNVIKFLELLAQSEGNLPKIIASAVWKLSESISYANKEKSWNQKFYSGNENCMQSLANLTQAFLNLGIDRLITLAASLFPKDPETTLVILRFVIRYKPELAIEGLKTFVESHYKTLQTFAKIKDNYGNSPQLEERLLCFIEASHLLVERDLNWWDIINEIGESYLYMRKTVFKERPLIKLESLLAKINSRKGLDNLCLGPVLSKCFLGDILGRVVFSKDGVPEIIGSWMLKNEIHALKTTRGQLNIAYENHHRGSHIQGTKIVITFKNRERNDQFPIDIFVAGERIVEDTHEAESFARYLVSVLGEACYYVTNDPVDPVKRQWAKLVQHYAKKFAKSIFSVVDDCFKDTRHNDFSKLFLKSLFESLSADVVLPHLAKIVSSIQSEPKKEYDYAPNTGILSFFGPVRFRQYLELVLKFAKNNSSEIFEKTFIRIRQISVLRNVFANLPIDDPLAKEIINFVKSDRPLLGSRVVKRELVKTYGEFWTGAIAAGLRNSDDAKFAVRFFADWAYFEEREEDKKTYLDIPSISIEMIPELLTRLHIAGSGPTYVDRYSSGDDFFKKNVSKMLDQAKADVHLEGVEDLDIRDLVENGSSQVRDTAIRIASLLILKTAKDTLGYRIFKLAECPEGEISKISISYIDRIYFNTRSKGKRAHILSEMIRRSKKHPAVFLPTLLSLAEQTKCLPFGVKEEKWKKQLFEILLDSIKHGASYSIHKDEGFISSLMQIADWDLANVISRILKIGERADSLLKALSTFMSHQGCPNEHQVSSQDFIALVTKCLSQSVQTN